MSHRDIILPAFDDQLYARWQKYSDCAEHEKAMQANRKLPIPVRHDSHIVLREALEAIALFLKREEHYDCPIYYHNSHNPNQVGFCWAESDGKRVEVFGACLFEWTKFGASNEFPACEAWRMMWVWFHPFDRQRGHLSSAWGYFCERFGRFFIMCPVSRSMARFLKRQKFWIEFDEDTGDPTRHD